MNTPVSLVKPEPTECTSASRWVRAADWLLVGLLATSCFLLGCYKLTSTDFWWHIRAGEWILEHGGTPSLDPFTFASADRVWIDLHWLFEIVLTLAFYAAGVRGALLLAAAMNSLAFLGGLSAQPKPKHVAVSVACWTPAVMLMSMRVHPRPEVFSLFFLAAFIAVLMHSTARPRVLWVLPPLQVLWVNMQGLFVLGPVLYATFMASEVFDRRTAGAAKPSRRTAILAGLALIAACLMNPYGLDGALLPLQLFPKISDPQNPYKNYISEFYSPLEYGARLSYELVAGSKHFALLYFLLLFVPLTFMAALMTHEFTDGRHASGRFGQGRMSEAELARLLGPGGGAILLLLSTFSLPGFAAPVWLRAIGEAAPALSVVAFLASAWLVQNSMPTMLACLASALALPVGMKWLQALMFGAAASLPEPTWQGLASVAAGALLGIMLWRGVNRFGLLLSLEFGFLALQAMRNVTLFALIAGIVVCRNLNEVFAAPCEEGKHARFIGAARLLLLALLGLATFAIPTGMVHRWLRSPWQFGLSESPLAFSHEATRFAGKDGLPDRALAYDLRMASLYVYHNGPAKKVYIDPRLELPSLEDFKTYVAIENSLETSGNDWQAKLEQIDARLILLDHDQHHMSEATLLSSQQWRLVYFDALAAVLVPYKSSVSETDYPAVDFAARHFHGTREPSVPGVPGAALHEARTLVNLGANVRKDRALTWPWRIPMLLHALDRLDLAEQQGAGLEDSLTLRGQCHWLLTPDLSVRPPSPGEGWNAAKALSWAQSTWQLRQALAENPQYAPALKSLYDSWRARSMPDAQLVVGRQLRELSALGGQQQAELIRLERQVASLISASGIAHKASERAVDFLTSRHCAATAAEFVMHQHVELRTWDWQRLDRLAAAWMHVGEPAQARELWNAASQAGFEAERLARLADSYLVERQFERAEDFYGQALEREPQLVAARWALAMMHIQRGDATSAHRACQAALDCDPPPELQATLAAFKAMLERCR